MDEWTLNPIIGVIREKKGRFKTEGKAMGRWRERLELCCHKPRNARSQQARKDG